MLHEVVVEIDAAPDAVWPVVADVERWHEWTESITSIEVLDGGGPIRLGSRAKVRQPKVPPVVWQVTDFQPGRSFTWVSKSVGLRSTAYHEISPRGDGGSVVRLAVDQQGPLEFVARLFTGITKKYLAMEAAGLKQRCQTPVR